MKQDGVLEFEEAKDNKAVLDEEGILVERRAKKEQTGGREVYKIGGLWDAARVVGTVGLCKRLCAQGEDVFRRGPDTVDGYPTFERFVFENGAPSERLIWRALGGDAAFWKATEYARRRFRKKSLCLFQALLRRYLPAERRGVDAHFDAHARVTMVVALNPPSDYIGGYYAQPTARVSSRRFAVLEAGEALAHDFGLRHGVKVDAGERFSLVLWFKSKKTAVSGRTPWHERRWTPDAAYMVASAAYRRGAPETQVAKAYEIAADMGSADAALNRGVLASARGDRAKAAHYFRRAADAGKPSAMRYLALAYVRGRGVPPNQHLAKRWLLRAARSDDPDAAYAAAATWPDDRRAPAWLRRAADLGHPDACLDLARSLVDLSVSHRSSTRTMAASGSSNELFPSSSTATRKRRDSYHAPPSSSLRVAPLVALAVRRAAANGRRGRAHLFMGRLYAGLAPWIQLPDLAAAFAAFAVAADAPDLQPADRCESSEWLARLYCGGGHITRWSPPRRHRFFPSPPAENKIIETTTITGGDEEEKNSHWPRMLLLTNGDGPTP